MMPVFRVLVYDSGTWAMNAKGLDRLGRAERMMVRRTFGLPLKERKPSDKLLSHLGIECVEDKIMKEEMAQDRCACLEEYYSTQFNNISSSCQS